MLSTPIFGKLLVNKKMFVHSKNAHKLQNLIRRRFHFSYYITLLGPSVLANFTEDSIFGKLSPTHKILLFETFKENAAQNLMVISCLFPIAVSFFILFYNARTFGPRPLRGRQFSYITSFILF